MIHYSESSAQDGHPRGQADSFIRDRSSGYDHRLDHCWRWCGLLESIRQRGPEAGGTSYHSREEVGLSLGVTPWRSAPKDVGALVPTLAILAQMPGQRGQVSVLGGRMAGQSSHDEIGGVAIGRRDRRVPRPIAEAQGSRPQLSGAVL